METTAEEIISEQQEEQQEEPVAKKVKIANRQSRSRSRSPLQTDVAKDIEEEDLSGSEEITTNDDTTLLMSTPYKKIPPFMDKGNRMFKPKLVLGNVPMAWTYDDIRNFIKGAVNSKHVADNVGYVCFRKSGLSKAECGTSIVYFGTEAAANEACARLEGKEVNGRKLTASVIRSEKKLDKVKKQHMEEQNQSATNKLSTLDMKPTYVVKKPQISNETYGLDIHYLKSLGLSPPLQPRIIVYNIDPLVDETKIREIFGLAGHIVDVHLFKKADGSLKWCVRIEYDHPVEAVQAISMFRNQKLYRKTLVLKMETSIFSYKRPIPVGLSGIGPGLGENGEPLKYVRGHVELQSLKELIQNLATGLERNPPQQQNVPTPNVPVPTTNVPAVSLLTDLIKMCQWNAGQMNVGSSQNNQTANIPHQNVNSFINTQIPPPTLIPTNLTQPNTPNIVPNVGNGNWQLQGNAGNSQPNQNPDYPDPSQYKNDYRKSPSSSSESYKRNRDSNKYKDTTTADDNYFRSKCGDIIVFKNLPSSVTVEALRAKMSEVGELSGVEMTGAGKALVRFVRERDAEKCIKLFDRSKVDGHTIVARFF